MGSILKLNFMFSLILITCLAHFGDADVSSAECTILF